MSDSIIVPDSLVAEYSRIKGVSLATARSNLEANIKKESEGVDLAQQYQTLIKAFRTMSPQLNGVILRETDTNASISQLKNEIRILKLDAEDLAQKLEFQKDVFARSIGILENIVEEDKKTIARISALEVNHLPLYKRIFNRIKCLLKR